MATRARIFGRIARTASSRRFCLSAFSSFFLSLSRCFGSVFFLPKTLSLSRVAPRLSFLATFFRPAISFLPIFWAIALILPATLLAAPAILRSRNWETNSITATAAAASALAKAGPAPPDLTAFRNAMKRSIAARIFWIAPQAAIQALDDRHHGARGRHDHGHEALDEQRDQRRRDRRLERLERHLADLGHADPAPW